MLAFLSINPDRVTQLFTGLLAVAGGYLAGLISVWAAAYFLDRRLTGGKSPNGMHKALRHVGGVVGALLVAFIVFGRGGSGGGTGDGNGPGKDGGAGGAQGDPATPATAGEARVRPLPPPPEVPAEEVVQVTILSGNAVKDAKFYLIDKDRTPRTFLELRELVRARQPSPAGKRLAIAIRYFDPAAVDPDNIGIRDVVNWARSTDVRVILPGKE